jgi:hypothetical protein
MVPPLGLGRGDTKHCKGSLENFLVPQRCLRIGVWFSQLAQIAHRKGVFQKGCFWNSDFKITKHHKDRFRKEMNDTLHKTCAICLSAKDIF